LEYCDVSAPRGTFYEKVLIRAKAVHGSCAGMMRAFFL